MKRILTAAAAMTLALGVAATANATTFVGVDTISAYPYSGTNTDNGLGILIDDPSDLLFNLTSVGQSTGFITLFRIYTNETSAQGDDFDDKNISLSFNFSQPLPGSSGGLSGETDTGTFLALATWGTLHWNNTSTLLNFGSGYQLRVDLESSDETFNGGGGLNFTPGIDHGADVRANFTLTKVPTAAPVPEPATWAMMISGFGLAGAALRRRRTFAAV